jgi:hypothetical protein
MPLTKCHLLLSDGTVTGKYQEVLIYALTTKPLLEYIQTKHSWSETTLKSIHWEAHARAIKRMLVPHTHLVTLLHQILPTHAQANKFDGGTRQCPVCTTTKEDFQHIIRCGHESRSTWRQIFLRDLRDHLIVSHSSPLLSGLQLEGIRQWFTSESAIHLCPEAFYPSLRSMLFLPSSVPSIRRYEKSKLVVANDLDPIRLGTLVYPLETAESRSAWTRCKD